MKKLIYLYILLYSGICFSQNIFLTEVKATNANKDKFLFALQKQPDSTAQYLGKIEVSGYSSNDVEVFSEIYKKAKSIGGNTYVLQSPEAIDGTIAFNPFHYFVYLYYTEAAKIPKQENIIYIINPGKEVELRLNNQKLNLPPRAYLQYDISKDEITDIAAGKLLGSRIKFQAKVGQPEQYFQISGNKISANTPVFPGINFKTGDIIKLEKSFALFLISIYQKK